MVLGHVDPEKESERAKHPSTSKGYGGWTHSSVSGKYNLGGERAIVDIDERVSGHLARMTQQQKSFKNLQPEEGEYKHQGNHMVRIESRNRVRESHSYHIENLQESEEFHNITEQVHIDSTNGSDEIDTLMRSPVKRQEYVN